MYLRSSNSLYSILACVYCIKNKAIYAEIPCFGGAGVTSISVGPRGLVSANHSIN